MSDILKATRDIIYDLCDNEATVKEVHELATTDLTLAAVKENCS